MKARDARVLLTGATGGIGQAAAGALLRAGAQVMLQGRSPAKLAALARALPSADAATPAAWHACDLADADTLGALADAAGRWGCNVVVHNAGVPGFGRLESLTPAALQQVLQLNLLAPMLLTQALLPHLRAQGEARVVFVGSVLGRLGLPGYSVYGASKFGLRGFAEALRRELGDGPVGVQYLGPRSTRTAFNDDAVAAYNRATGTAMDDPETAARALVQLIESGAAERFLGFPERLAVRLNGLAPGLLDGAFAKHRQSLPPARPDTAPGGGLAHGAP
nr:SDR family oxidoreductase [Variovorax boronicumulans]